MASLNIAKLFKDEAEKIIKAREKSIDIHRTRDIRAAGDQVEIPIREFFDQMLPKRFHVTHGHLIDRNGVVSPQLDLIISDNTTIPSLLTTADDTHYVPVESVYAIAEIKSTFYKSKNHIENFAKTLHFIREDMTRPLIENTIYGGLIDSTDFRDIFLQKPNKFLNPLFSFMFFVNSGDADDAALEKIFTRIMRDDLPGITVLLDKAVVLYAKRIDKNVSFKKYPWLEEPPEYTWFVSSLEGRDETGSLEGNHLGMIYYALLEHLNQSFLQPPDIRSYFHKVLIGSGANCRKLEGR
jgi:hypothetical protein